LIIPEPWRVGLAVFALRMASRRCFLTAIAVLALAILLVAMTAAGGPAQAVADALLIDTDTNVAFGNISGEHSRTMDVGTTPEGTIWFRVRPAVQFAWGFLNPESAKTVLSKMFSEDGVPDGIRKGLWKVGAAKREGGKGSWSCQFATLRNVVKTQVLHARGAPASNAWAHVVIPDDVQVQDFLDRCQEAGRQELEKKIVALRTAGAGSLDLDTAQVDAVFASNCFNKILSNWVLQDS